MKKLEFRKLIREEIRKSLNEMKASDDGAEYVGKTIKAILQDDSSVHIQFTDGKKMIINVIGGGSPDIM